VLAPALAAAGYHVVCPDLVGRGDSDRLADPRGYHMRRYLSDIGTLLTQLGTSAVDWIGTSLGGLIGMTLAAQPGTPVHRLVLNDIGPFIPRAAIRRLDSHLADDPTFADLPAAEAYLRGTRAPFGALTDEQWARMAERTTRQDGRGGYRLHFDAGIATRFHEASDRDGDAWTIWDGIECPVLVLRGERSDLLLAETAAEMATRGPGADVIEFTGRGHNPPLLDGNEVQEVVAWLGDARSP